MLERLDDRKGRTGEDRLDQGPFLVRDRWGGNVGRENSGGAGELAGVDKASVVVEREQPRWYQSELVLGEIFRCSVLTM